MRYATASGLFAAILVGSTISGTAFAAGFAVHTNCTVTPCVMGVAPPEYSTPGNVNYVGGWRQLSQTYKINAQALRTLCRWHYGKPGYSAPDVVSGAVNCAALCNGNPSCP